MQLVNILEIDVDKRLDKFLCEKFDVSFGLAQKMVRQKKIKVNGSRVEANYRLGEGDEIAIFTQLSNRIMRDKKKTTLSPEKIKNFESYIIYEDEDMAAIDKPSGIAVQGGSGISFCVDDFAAHKGWSLVHRLDKDTSGVLLLAKNKECAQKLLDGFKNKTIKKTYEAYILGHLNKEEGVIDIALKKKSVKGVEKVYPDFEEGKEAITHFRVLQEFDDYSHVELSPVTGRTHQLRVHMKEMGCPIINDIKYGGSKVSRKDIAKSMCLHAKRVEVGDKVINSHMFLDY